MRGKTSHAGVTCAVCVSTGGTESSFAEGGKTSVVRVAKKMSGCEASYGGQCDTWSSPGMHACTLVMNFFSSVLGFICGS